MKRRKNFLPAFLLSILSWLLWIYIIIFTAPDSSVFILIFYMMLFFSLFLSISLFLANSRRGLLLTLGIIGAALLEQTKLLNILNLVLLVGILISAELFSSRH